MYVVGGGCLTDYDVINYSLRPEHLDIHASTLTFYGYRVSLHPRDVDESVPKFLKSTPQTGPVCGR